MRSGTHTCPNRLAGQRGKCAQCRWRRYAPSPARRSARPGPLINRFWTFQPTDSGGLNRHILKFGIDVRGLGELSVSFPLGVHLGAQQREDCLVLWAVGSGLGANDVGRVGAQQADLLAVNFDAHQVR